MAETERALLSCTAEFSIVSILSKNTFMSIVKKEKIKLLFLKVSLPTYSLSVTMFGKLNFITIK